MHGDQKVADSRIRLCDAVLSSVHAGVWRYVDLLGMREGGQEGEATAVWNAY